MSTHDMALVGAPDALLGTPQAKSQGVQAMQFTMTNEILEELLECVKNGKPPQILFGHNPILRCNGVSHTLESQPEEFRHEIYTTSDNDDDEWSFAGVVNHSLSIPPREDDSAGLDAALEALKNRVAAEKVEREANKSIITTPDMHPVKARGARGNLLKPPTSLPRTSSPSLTASQSPSYLSPPKSAPLENMFRINPKDPAIRRALLLFLSFEQRSVKDCRTIIGGRSPNSTENDRNIQQALKGIAMCNDPTNIKAKWTLLERSYKELRPYDNFRWPSKEAKEKAVDNAIRAFDRMRIPRDDLLWQTLLPEEDRGKGIFLSRLNIQETAAQNRTPAATPTRFDRKTGLPKKTESKKTEKVEKEEKQKKTSKNADKETSKLAKAKDSTKTESKSTPVVKPVKRVEHEKLKPKSPAVGTSTTSRPRSLTASSIGKGGKGGKGTSTGTRDSKPSTAAKSLLNKPKNPSPLSKSPPVNASDFEESHPVHKKLSAAVSPAKKRKADEVDHGPQRNGMAAKRQHLDTPTSDKRSVSSSSAEKEKELVKPKRELTNGATTSLKRKAIDMDSDFSSQSTPTKARKIDRPAPKTTAAPSHRANGVVTNGRKEPSPGTETSEDGGPIKLTWKQALDMAVRYEKYYPLYQKLWTEIVNSDVEPTPEKREQLQKMHNKLKVMKDQIAQASWRGRDGKGVES